MQTKFNLKIILLSTTILASPAEAGDGQGDFRTASEALYAGYTSSEIRPVSGGCGACNGPKGMPPVVKVLGSGGGGSSGGYTYSGPKPQQTVAVRDVVQAAADQAAGQAAGQAAEEVVKSSVRL